MENTQPTAVPRPRLAETFQEQRCAMRRRLEAAWQLQMARIEQVIEERFQETEARVQEAFRLNFVVGYASMADYLHLELVRTLANDDPLLLGPGYPGPLV